MMREHTTRLAAFLRGFAPWLLLLALLLRGMIPGGFMPNTDAAPGEGWLVICTSAGLKSVHPDGGDGAAGPLDSHPQGVCAFSLLAAVAPLLLLVALLLPQRPRRVGYATPGSLLPPALALCRPPGARAPPAMM